MYLHIEKLGGIHKKLQKKKLPTFREYIIYHLNREDEISFASERVCY